MLLPGFDLLACLAVWILIRLPLSKAHESIPDQTHIA